MSEFDTDTAVRGVGDGAYEADLSDRWSVGGRPNGGYLLAVLARALGASLGQPDPLTMTAHFLRAPAPGPARIDIEVVREGRTLSTAEARLRQGDTEYVRVLGAFGDLDAAKGPRHVELEPPALPAPERCVGVPEDGRMPDGLHISLMERFDLRLTPESVGWLAGRPSGRGEHAGWLRFRDGREPDLLSLALVVDAFAPAVLSTGHLGSVPTIELTAHFRAHPAPGWLRMVTRTRALLDGYLEEDAEVWDSEGTLVAMSRQFARLSGPGEG
jgi:acyl-CoA thioesterase